MRSSWVSSGKRVRSNSRELDRKRKHSVSVRQTEVKGMTLRAAVNKHLLLYFFKSKHLYGLWRLPRVAGLGDRPQDMPTADTYRALKAASNSGAPPLSFPAAAGPYHRVNNRAPDALFCCAKSAQPSGQHFTSIRQQRIDTFFIIGDRIWQRGILSIHHHIQPFQSRLLK